MDTTDDVIRIQESAETLQKVLKTKLPDGLQDLAAVQERLEAYNVHGNRFSERVFKFLKDQFEQQVNSKYNCTNLIKPFKKTGQIISRKEDKILTYREQEKSNTIKYCTAS